MVYGLSRTHAQRPLLLLLSTLAGAAAYGCARPLSHAVVVVFKRCDTYSPNSFLHVACRPVHGPGGELVDGGSDIGAGACETASDVLLLVAGVHLLSAFFRPAWYLLLLVPCSLLYSLSTSALMPALKAMFGALSGGGGGAEQKAGKGTPHARSRERDARQKQMRQQHGRK